MLIKPENSAHWYNADGSPAYETLGKNGKVRKTTLADARKVGLVPSVTTILKIVANPGLDAWKRSQLVESALTFPQNGRPVDDCVREIVADANKVAADAAKFGTQVHDLIECTLANGSASFRDALPGALSAVNRFLELYNPLGWINTGLEVPFCAHGYGGKIDWLGHDVEGVQIVLDYKTQRTKAGEPFKVYKSWGAQLAGYAEGVSPGARLVNIVMSSTEPDREAKLVEWEDYDEMKYAFFCAYDLWCGPLGKSFDPEKNLKEIGEKNGQK